MSGIDGRDRVVSYLDELGGSVASVEGTFSGTTAVPIIAAPGASSKLWVKKVILDLWCPGTAVDAATTIDFEFGTTKKFGINVPILTDVSFGPKEISFPGLGLEGTTNGAFNAVQSQDPTNDVIYTIIAFYDTRDA